jgi:hypothetical protein
MEKRTDSPYPSIDRPVMALIGVVLVLGTVAALSSPNCSDTMLRNSYW